MLIDTHCHLVHKKYKKSPETLVKEAQKEGVEKIITVGTNLKNNEVVIKTAEKLSNVFATVGIYPNDERGKNLDNLISALEKQIHQSEKIVGVGECGFDITAWENQRPLEEQKTLFIRQIELAINHSLPVVIHNRNGDEHILKILASHKNTGLTGVFHCFTSTWETAKKALDFGFYLSFTGIITYPSGKNIWETVEKAPLDRIIVETDAPYLSPQGYRDKVNEPKYVKITAKTLADIKKVSFDELSEAMYKNSCQLFSRIA